MIHTPLAPAGIQLLWMHDSQSPFAQEEARQRSLATAQIDHQFLYSSTRQAELWLALHAQFSPIKTDDVVQEIYRNFSTKWAQQKAQVPLLHVIGLGAGGAKKDRLVLEALTAQHAAFRFTPIDISPTLSLLSARQTADLVDLTTCPIVADLARFPDLPHVLKQLDGGNMPRVFTCFGLLPNFEPEIILPQLYRWLRPQDSLLLSANLVPGADLVEGLAKLLPQYENPETQAWLTRLLLDWGMENETGDYQIKSEVLGPDYGRFTASVAWHGPLATAERLRLFFSYRYTQAGLMRLLKTHSFSILPVTACVPSGQEGIWALTRLS